MPSRAGVERLMAPGIVVEDGGADECEASCG